MTESSFNNNGEGISFFSGSSTPVRTAQVVNVITNNNIQSGIVVFSQTFRADDYITLVGVQANQNEAGLLSRGDGVVSVHDSEFCSNVNVDIEIADGDLRSHQAVTCDDDEGNDVCDCSCN